MSYIVYTKAAIDAAVAARQAAAAQTYAAGGNADRFQGFGAPQHEDGATYAYPNRLTFGPVNAAPAARTAARKTVDILAHWYNDFGLELEASSSTQANGAYFWYDWSWNFPTNTGDGVTANGYDPARHPLQGFYQGDNAAVLDWQCYWMAEAGVNVVNLVNQAAYFSSTGWATPANPNYWMYQLFTNVKNFKALRYVLGLQYTSSQSTQSAKETEIQAQNDDLVNIYKTYPGAYTYTEAGKTYAVAFLWDAELLRGVYDNYSGQTATVAYLKALAVKFQAAGYDGVMVLARHSGLVYSSPDPTLKAAGVIFADATYSDVYPDSGGSTTYSSSYANYVASSVFPTDPGTIIHVNSSAQKQYPHDGLTLAGSTPTLFGQLLRRAVDSVLKHGQRRIVTVYNVSEWAEAGPGLLPQVRDGFGYLDQIRALPTAGGSGPAPSVVGNTAQVHMAAGTTQNVSNYAGFDASLLVAGTTAGTAVTIGGSGGALYLVVNSPGTYLIHANALLDGGPTSRLEARVTVNGTVVAAAEIPSAVRARLPLAVTVVLAVGDQVKLNTYVENDGSSFTKLTSTVASDVFLSMTRFA